MNGASTGTSETQPYSTDMDRNPWFGEAWPSPDRPAPVCDDVRYQVPTPVGETCLWCSEPIAEDDRGIIMPYVHLVDGEPRTEMRPVHRECNMRSVLGSVAHLEGRCSCEGGTDYETPGLTAREESLAVQDWIEQHGTLG